MSNLNTIGLIMVVWFVNLTLLYDQSYTVIPTHVLETNEIVEFDIYYNNNEEEDKTEDLDVDDLEIKYGENIELVDETPENSTTKKDKKKVKDIEYVTDTFTITAYCSCSKCCGNRNNTKNGKVFGAEGTYLYPNQSIATSRNIPFGTKIEIDGLGTYTVQDRVGLSTERRYSKKIIDIYFTDHQKALNFGKQTRDIKYKKG